MNLLAPILVNQATRTAAQVILDEDWPLQAELIAPEADRALTPAATAVRTDNCCR